MAEIIIGLVSIAVGLAMYCIRIENRITEILTDLCWIKKEIAKNANNPGTEILD